jgi:L,D-transpeptidase ErfK/SrfK
MDNENLNNIDKQDENLNVPEQAEQSELPLQPEHSERIVQPEQILQDNPKNQEKPKRKPFLKSFFGRLLKGIILIVVLYIIVVVLPVPLQNIALPISLIGSGHVSDKEASEMAESKAILEKSIEKLDKQLDALIPNDCYMIINSTDNEFTLKKGNVIVRKGKCSTGSYLMLESEKKQKKWLFKTPKGQLTVRSKKTDPVWTKPDWAFIEEGLPVPGPNHPSRFEEGVLGDYALVLGDGYMIHGTLWQRYLGLSVTHGCVRLNDADLEVVYKSLNKGSKVYIY